MKRNYNDYNAENVLTRLEGLIAKNKSCKMRQKLSTGYELCDELSIFDWWKDTLSVSDMKKMRAFLREAIKMGYKGHVCFKVGVTGCANGMWASVKPTTDKYSSDGPCLYRAFTPEYDYWSYSTDGHKWIGGKGTTKKDIHAWLRIDRFVNGMYVK